MISVCVVTFNGGLYIREQLQSILLSPLVGEVIVSDDRSSDDTCEIVSSFDDPRLKLVKGPGCGLIRNYESLLQRASGEIIFLSDQDDVWLPEKVPTMLEHLQYSHLVVCDCRVVDAQLQVLYPSFFSLKKSRPGLMRNLWRNRYLGCCMAFRRDVLRCALPFPANIAMHDWWLGLVAEMSGETVFINQALTLYRRHGSNASVTTETSSVPWAVRIRWRFAMLTALCGRKIAFLGQGKP